MDLWPQSSGSQGVAYNWRREYARFRARPREVHLSKRCHESVAGDKRSARQRELWSIWTQDWRSSARQSIHCSSRRKARQISWSELEIGSNWQMSLTCGRTEVSKLLAYFSLMSTNPTFLSILLRDPAFAGSGGGRGAPMQISISWN